MKKVIKNALLVIIAMFIMISGLTGCENNKPQTSTEGTIQMTESVNDQELQYAKEKLLKELFRLLEANESVYSSIFRILDHTDSYLQDNSWENLLKARASGSAALVTIRQMEFPLMELTEEEIEVLMAAGVEVNAAQRECEALAGRFADMDVTVSLLTDTLENDVFLTASVADAIPAMTAFYREYFTLEYRYLSQFANYLLLQMNEVDIWPAWKEELPCMAACADIWYEATVEVERAAGELFDKMDDLQTQMGSFLGTSEYTLEIVLDAVATGDLETLQREINQIPGVPGYYPVPGWMPDVLYLYLVTDPDAQEKRLVQAGEELTSIPSACYISCGEISVEDVEAYEERLAFWGIETYSTWNESKDTYQILAKSGSCTMMVEWTENETLLYLTEPVGCLIPELYLRAMIME